MVRLRDGRALALGGANAGAGLSECKHSADLFDPATTSWSAAAPIHLGRCRTSAVVLRGGRVLVAGGMSHHAWRSAEIDNPRNGRWHWTDPMSMGRVVMGLTRMRNGDLLVAGTCPPKTHLLTAERYVVSRHVWRPAG